MNCSTIKKFIVGNSILYRLSPSAALNHRVRPKPQSSRFPSKESQGSQLEMMCAWLEDREDGDMWIEITWAAHMWTLNVQHWQSNFLKVSFSASSLPFLLQSTHLGMLLMADWTYGHMPWCMHSHASVHIYIYSLSHLFFIVRSAETSEMIDFFSSSVSQAHIIDSASHAPVSLATWSISVLQPKPY